MDKGIEAIGMRLRSALQAYATGPKKHRDLELGVIIGLKQSLDLMGEASYALQCIYETTECLETKKTSRQVRRILNMF